MIFFSVRLFSAWDWNHRIENSVCQMCLITYKPFKWKTSMKCINHFTETHMYMYVLNGISQKKESPEESSAFCHMNFGTKRLFVVLKSMSNDRKRTNHDKSLQLNDIYLTDFFNHQNHVSTLRYSRWRFFSVVLTQKLR